jgi:hypothetical protein
MVKNKGYKYNGIFYVVISLIAIFGLSISVNAATQYQILNIPSMLRYEPDQYDRFLDGAVVLRPGVIPIPGTVKIYNEDENLGAMPGPDISSEYLSVNGLTVYVKNGTFKDATTTPFAVKNPYNATSTLDLAILDFDNGTSTVSFYVATSTSAFTDGTAGDGNIVNKALTVTSTHAYIVNGVTGVGLDSGHVSAGTNTLTRVLVGPNNWVIGRVYSSDSEGNAITALDGAILDPATNAFKGTYKLRFIR